MGKTMVVAWLVASGVAGSGAGVSPGPVHGPELPAEVMRAVRDHDPAQTDEVKEARVERLLELARSTGNWEIAYWATHLARFSAAGPDDVPAWSRRALLAFETLDEFVDQLSDLERSHVDVLAFMVYDFATFGLRLQSDTVSAQYVDWTERRAMFVREAISRAPHNPLAMTVAGTILIRSGARDHDAGAVMAGCALQTRALALLPAAGLSIQPEWPGNWAAAGRRDVARTLGEVPAEACRPSA